MQTLSSAPLRWLVIAFAACVVFNLAAISALVWNGNSLAEALSVTTVGQTRRLVEPTGSDSWRPMAVAFNSFKDNPEGDLYDVFFDQDQKFQYPPTALLILELFPSSFSAELASTPPEGPLPEALRVPSILALVVTVFVSFFILRTGLQRTDPHVTRGLKTSAGMAALACILGATFYPLVQGVGLGQIQVFLGGLIVTALLAYQNGKVALAGVCLALCTLVKPQYGVVLLWGLARRDFRFVFAFMVVGTIGLIVAIADFGFDSLVSYLDVLSYIASHGEAYWANQSVNGFVNRLLDNGNATSFSSDDFAPYHPVVYAATVASSVIFLVAAWWPPSGRNNALQSKTVDLTAMLIAATMASPIAWEHHFGFFLGAYAVLLPEVMKQQPLQKWIGVALLMSYLMVANIVVRPDMLARNILFELAGSHLFFGALILMGLCLAIRHVRTAAEPAGAGVLRPAP